MKAVITLGCEGYQEKGFHFCEGVENIILDLEEIQKSENYFQLIQYLDAVVKIFEGPCNNMNIITNAMYKIYTLGYLTDLQHHYIAHFYNMHRRCSLIMEAKPKI